MRTNEDAVRPGARQAALRIPLAALLACDTFDDDLADRKLHFERGVARHQRELARLQQENEQLAAMAAVIDRTSQDAIDAYNARVDVLDFARNRRCATLVLNQRDSEIHRRDDAGNPLSAKRLSGCPASCASAGPASSAGSRGSTSSRATGWSTAAGCPSAAGRSG